jgi:hypothetical protein
MFLYDFMLLKIYLLTINISDLFYIILNKFFIIHEKEFKNYSSFFYLLRMPILKMILFKSFPTSDTIKNE